MASPDSAAGLVQIDIAGTMGALQIGSTFALFTFGIVTLQAHIYFYTFPNDNWKHKLLVIVVWIFELTHTVGIAYEVYRTTITLYGQPEKLTMFPVLGSLTAVSGGITFFVQLYFCLRLYKTLPRPWCHVGSVCSVLSTLRCAASVYLAYRAAVAPNIPQYRADMSWLISALLIVGAIVDVAIAASMLRYLTTKRDVGFERLTTIVDRLITYTIRTGVLTSVSAVVLLITFLAMPNNLVWLALYSFLAKLYSNSLYSALNSRQSLREELTASIPSGERYSRSKGVRRDVALFEAISIQMKTTTETMQDDLKAAGRASYHVDADKHL